MAKLLFIPVSLGASLAAGFVSKKVFDQLWGLIDEEEPPESKHRDIDWRKLLLAAAVQGAMFRAVREASDHYTRMRVREDHRDLARKGTPRRRIAFRGGKEAKPEAQLSGITEPGASYAHLRGLDDRPTRPCTSLITDA